MRFAARRDASRTHRIRGSRQLAQAVQFEGRRRSMKRRRRSTKRDTNRPELLSVPSGQIDPRWAALLAGKPFNLRR